ncbi:hypothetical protein QU593_10560 [Rossellomorea marisflavi]|uniref:hypothetical protein n=1 Tax=Rossellomorea marisflavi TaxID=189381 RepID=UPI0025AF7223|nr:hypothetical protein [Rossellomorea marisflavi]WJV20848.1 hypothetical protein QU593_10560 [Rossellomorea marisflavi]
MNLKYLSFYIINENELLLDEKETLLDVNGDIKVSEDKRLNMLILEFKESDLSDTRTLQKFNNEEVLFQIEGDRKFLKESCEFFVHDINKIENEMVKIKLKKNTFISQVI